VLCALAIDELLQLFERKLVHVHLPSRLCRLRDDGLGGLAIDPVDEGVESSPVVLIDAGPEIGVDDFAPLV